MRLLGPNLLNKATLLALVLLASCGPSAEEEKRTREAARQRSVAASQQELTAFAKSHDATPIDLFGTGELSRKLTLQLQRETEGKIIAFRTELLDLVRVSGDDYEVEVGYDLSSDVVALTAPKEIAEKILTASAGAATVELLVAAQIDQVRPLSLKLESCTSKRDDNCLQLLASGLHEVSHRVSGKALAIDIEQVVPPVPFDPRSMPPAR